MFDYSLLYGRELLIEEIDSDPETFDLNKVTQTAAFKKEKNQLICMRCHTPCVLKQAYPCTCSNKCVYCRECIALGKVKACSQLYSLPEPNAFTKHTRPYLRWEGSLSPQQKEASLAIIDSIRQNDERIIWAVAGAGKTEMLFEGIGEALEGGKRVCVVSPRIDVCLELAPRFEKAFPEVPLALLYGGAKEPYRYTQLVIGTTHQMYRFKEAFDVLVIDEIDAFPYHMNEALYFATKKARKEAGATIYLTATPDKVMQKKIKRGQIAASILPARYHRYALPVPKALYQRAFVFEQNERVVRHMKELLAKKKCFLVFIPTIFMMEKVSPILRKVLPEVRFECVHSQDADRKEKVLRMRNKELDFLVTTTILERGVTFPNIDVLVIQADHRVYTEAALVQISGRAGRSADFPKGEVTFYHQGWTRAMKGAIKQIKKMNDSAKKKGYLL